MEQSTSVPLWTSPSSPILCGMSSDIAGGFIDPRIHLERESRRLILRDMVSSFEKSLIVAALQAAGGSHKRAAVALGIVPTTLQERLKRLGLTHRPPERRTRREGRVFAPGDRPPPHLEAPTPSQEKRDQ